MRKFVRTALVGVLIGTMLFDSALACRFFARRWSCRPVCVSTCRPVCCNTRVVCAPACHSRCTPCCHSCCTPRCGASCGGWEPVCVTVDCCESGPIVHSGCQATPCCGDDLGTPSAAGESVGPGVSEAPAAAPQGSATREMDRSVVNRPAPEPPPMPQVPPEPPVADMPPEPMPFATTPDIERAQPATLAVEEPAEETSELTPPPAEDDLFGQPTAQPADDLFGEPAEQPTDDDLFGAPMEEPADTADDLFGTPAEEAEEPAAEEPAEEPADMADDLFGEPEEPTDDDLFSQPDDDQPADEQPMDEQPMDEQPMDEQPMEEQPMEDDLFGGEQPAGEESADELFGPLDEEQPMDEPPLDQEPAEEPAADEEFFDEPAEEPEPSVDELFGTAEEGTDDATRPAEDDLFGPLPGEEQDDTQDMFGEEPAEETPAEDTPPDDELFGPFGRILREPGGLASSELRQWVDNTGRYSCNGRLIRVLDGQVRILKDNDHTTTVPFYRLSGHDLEFVNRQAAAERDQALTQTARM